MTLKLTRIVKTSLIVNKIKILKHHVLKWYVGSKFYINKPT